MLRDFINVFKRRPKLFEVNFFMKETFRWMFQPGKVVLIVTPKIVLKELYYGKFAQCTALIETPSDQSITASSSMITYCSVKNLRVSRSDKASLIFFLFRFLLHKMKYHNQSTTLKFQCALELRTLNWNVLVQKFPDLKIRLSRSIASLFEKTTIMNKTPSQEEFINISLLDIVCIYICK